MSAALKFATLASGFTLFGAATYHTFRTPKQDFSQNALALEHSGESLPKAPKMYVSQRPTNVLRPSDIVFLQMR